MADPPTRDGASRRLVGGASAVPLAAGVALVAALAGAVAGWWAGARGVPPSSGAADAGLRAEVERLASEVDASRLARERLEAELELLRVAVRDAVDGGRDPRVAARLRDATDPSDVDPPHPANGHPPERPMRARNDGFGVDALVSAGVSEDEALALRERWQALELERLYLSNEASREGWLQTKRFVEQNARLEAELRQEVGEDRWDRMLYGAGRPNRVVVSSVLDGSEAASLGLAEGDQLLSYGGSRVFTPDELRAATREGEVGELVAIEWWSDGEAHRGWLPRGPIGTLIEAKRVPPETTN